MALNPNYILLPPLQNLFRDKDTGLPLSNGYLLFFADNQRTVGKEVFQLTGSPPNYSYITLGQLNTDGSWQVNLDQNGVIANNVSACNLYWFPFDSSGNVQLYYVVVYNSGGVLQYALEAEPNFIQSGSETSAINTNYVPNGQFLWHTNIPAVTPLIPEGRVQEPITNIAYGGWTFERPNASTATDNVVFERFDSWSSNPPANPRYACRISCTTPDPADTFKDLRLKFVNVNRFATDTDYFTYGFTAQSNSGSTATVEIVLIKNFGTGGSSSTQTPLGSLTIATTESNYFISFIPGDNSGQTIGPFDDDYIQIAIRYPTSSTFDISITDVLDTDGQFTNTTPPVFTETTNSQFAYQSGAGFLDIPDYNSRDLYLPIILTPTGLTYDTNQVGKIFTTVLNSAGIGELMCDGTGYIYNNFSSDGIPYNRLGDKLWNSTLNIYPFGTGNTYVMSNQVITTGQDLKLTTNAAGSVTVTADGSSPTGFTFNTVKVGNTTYGMKGYCAPIGVFIQMDSLGSYANPTNGTTGWNVFAYVNNSSTFGVVAVQSITAASGLAGKYFTIGTPSGLFYVWFKVNGSGTDPAPGGTGIEIDLLSSYGIDEVCQCIADAVSGRQISNIITTAASSITAGSFWTFNTLTTGYYVWYQISGTGTDPAPSDRIGLKVSLAGTENNIQVNTETLIVINRYMFAVPDLRGYFLRGIDNGAGIDPNINSRFSLVGSLANGDTIGSIQLSDILAHNHTFTPSTVVIETTTSPSTLTTTVDQAVTTSSTTIGYSGTSESRPINIYINYVIKY